MSIVGWYYLHENGELIYKVDHDGTAADIRDSSFARGLWPIDPNDRLGAWNLLVEALAANANRARVKELAAKWHCTDIDAANYAERVGAKISIDGPQWCATSNDFIDLQQSPAGFGDTALEAMAELCKELGYRPSKMWGASFRDLLKESAA
jgi:hypothetical protein